jgi:hypothetical protein
MTPNTSRITESSLPCKYKTRIATEDGDNNSVQALRGFGVLAIVVPQLLYATAR